MTYKGKILFLGGKPIGSVEMVKRLQELGYYVIVTDYLPNSESPAKQIANESWNISTADLNILKNKFIENGVSGIMTGVHEFNINRMLDLCEDLGLPCYCSKETWRFCDNKVEFKNLCKQNGVPVAPIYKIEDLRDNEKDYPVIVKPVDGSGSRGFHICNSFNELLQYYAKARDFSPSNEVLIEKYVPFNAVIIHYTMLDGKCVYSGMSDKISVKFQNTGASVMGIQTFPSIGEKIYLSLLDQKVRRMFENAGFENGPIWIEAFYDGFESFVFNEMGYRFGGSLTYLPVKYFYNIDQLDLMISNATGCTKIISRESIKPPCEGKKYCILPLHIHKGKIHTVVQSKFIANNSNIYAIVPVHYVGDEIQDWGSAQQVFAYIHILFSNLSELKSNIKMLLDNFKVLDEQGNNMIYTLFNLSNLEK